MGIRLEILVTLHFLIAVCLGKVLIITAPQNQVVVHTQAVTFTCGVQQADDLDAAGHVIWQECTAPGGATCREISRDDTITYIKTDGETDRKARFSVARTGDKEYSLKISGALIEDGGQYRCLATNDPDVYRSAELIYLSGDTECDRNTTVENEAIAGQYIKTACTVVYRGRWAPVMSWSRNDADVVAMESNVANVVIDSTLTLRVGPANNGDLFTVRTYFNIPEDTGDFEATNRPDYENIFTFQRLTVWSPPQTVTISPREDSYMPGDTLLCTTSANPEPSYQWRDAASGEVISDSDTLVISTGMVGERRYTCTASNRYGNTTLQIGVNVSACRACSVLLIAVGVLAAVLAVSLLLNIIALVYIKRHGSATTKTEQKAPTRQPVQHTNSAGEGAGEGTQNLSYEVIGEREPVTPSVYDDISRQYPDFSRGGKVLQPETGPYQDIS